MARRSLPGRRLRRLSDDAFVHRMHVMLEYRLSSDAIASTIRGLWAE
jgi:hypothetical protein